MTKWVILYWFHHQWKVWFPFFEIPCECDWTSLYIHLLRGSSWKQGRTNCGQRRKTWEDREDLISKYVPEIKRSAVCKRGGLALCGRLGSVVEKLIFFLLIWSRESVICDRSTRLKCKTTVKTQKIWRLRWKIYGCCKKCCRNREALKKSCQGRRWDIYITATHLKKNRNKKKSKNRAHSARTRVGRKLYDVTTTTKSCFKENTIRTKLKTRKSSLSPES